jgi:hypothetical protein
LNLRIGEKLEEFDPRRSRRILVGQYEMRYEIQASTIFVLRLWHRREDRWRLKTDIIGMLILRQNL